MSPSYHNHHVAMKAQARPTCCALRPRQQVCENPGCASYLRFLRLRLRTGCVDGLDEFDAREQGLLDVLVGSLELGEATAGDFEHRQVPFARLGDVLPKETALALASPEESSRPSTPSSGRGGTAKRPARRFYFSWRTVPMSRFAARSTAAASSIAPRNRGGARQG